MHSDAVPSSQTCLRGQSKLFSRSFVDLKIVFSWTHVLTINRSKSIKFFKFKGFQASSASHGMVAQTLVVTRRAEILLFSKSNYGARHIGQGSEWSEIEIFDMYFDKINSVCS